MDYDSRFAQIKVKIVCVLTVKCVLHSPYYKSVSLLNVCFNEYTWWTFSTSLSNTQSNSELLFDKFKLYV